MKRYVVGLVPLLVFGLALWAGDEPKEKPKEDKKPTPQEQYKALMDEVQKSRSEAVKAVREAKNDQDRDKAIEIYHKKPQEFVGKFLELAQKNPKDKVAFDALQFIIMNAPSGPDADKAMEILFQDHKEKLASLYQSVRNARFGAAEKFLRTSLEKATEHKDQGQITFALAQFLKNKSQTPKLPKEELEKLNKEIEDLFDRIVEKFADVGTYAKDAERDLFEIRNLSVGKVVPEIEGEDMDGKKIKLSDYRGKVVMLDFWGHW
ncbi:MAG TPA: hypothetical protein VGY77_12070 [Gemmataceae bacterium]|jgi:hypothetical protein|nr:hypothetical protein [Gemmataceae bacterium]